MFVCVILTCLCVFMVTGPDRGTQWSVCRQTEEGCANGDEAHQAMPGKGEAILTLSIYSMVSGPNQHRCSGHISTKAQYLS